jgi:hypothetical protein
LSLIANIGIFLTHANHHSSVAWATHDAWKNSPWCIIASKPSLRFPIQISNHNQYHCKNQNFKIKSISQIHKQI